MPREDRSGAGQPAPSRETIVVHKGHGLPYSKGLMAQALSATALSQERSFELARLIESRLAERGAAEIDVEALHALVEEVLLAHEDAVAPAGAMRFTLRPEPAEPLPEGARVALFTTGAPACDGVEPLVASTNLARRSALADDLERAAAAGCDLYLTELKAAAIDTVARHAAERGARVVFVRNRPVGVDDALMELASV